VNGTTGEGYSLAKDERERNAEAWLREQTDDFAVLVHVGAESVRDARDLAAHAAANGAAAIGATSPAFYAPSAAEMIDWIAEVTSTASVSFYYYHIPSMSGARFEVSELLSLAAGRLPNLAGVKFTHDDLLEFRRCVGLEQGRYRMLFGRDEILLAALSMGATGFVGSTYNYAMPGARRIAERFAAGDTEGAVTQQDLLMQHVLTLREYGGIACGKALMRSVGLDVGAPRLPNHAISPETAAHVVSESRALGVME
jgi:N-acetylneuraminate lyase